MINNYRYLLGPKFVNRASLGRLITNFCWVYNHCFNIRIFHIMQPPLGWSTDWKIFRSYLWKNSSNKMSNIYTLCMEHHHIMKSRYINYFIIELTMKPVGKNILNFSCPTQYFKVGFSFWTIYILYPILLIACFLK